MDLMLLVSVEAMYSYRKLEPFCQKVEGNRCHDIGFEVPRF